jgi:predicted MFS family arabinose efflux permease
MNNPAGPAGRAPKDELPWLIIFAGCAVALLTFGPRSAMGFFQLPLLEERGWDRTTFGLAMAIQNLMWGVGQPVFGAIADRVGSARVLLVSFVLYSSGLVLMAYAPTPFWLHMSGGVLIGLGISAGSFGIIMAALARRVPADKRSFVFGMATAAGSAGMFAFSPISILMIDALGWADALVGLAVIMGLIPVAAAILRGKPQSAEEAQAVEQTMGEALRQAFAHQSYLLLVAGFFVCGFQVAFITAHFPAYISDLGIEAKWAAIALMMIGLFNIVGSLASGYLGQRKSKPMMLVWIYLGRSVAVTIFLLLPASPLTVTVFSIVMGLLWLSTVPPTNALVAVMFGTRNLGMLGGIVFFSHQIGSFLGVWLGGYFYDLYGSYDPVWWLGVALGIFAAVVHWPIREAPAPALQPAVA